MHRTLRPLLAAMLALAAAAACDDEPAGPPAIAAITISAPATVVELGDTLRLTATATDARGRAITGTPIGWTSLEAAVAEVDSTGLVTAVEVGSARIVAAVGSHADTVALTIIAAPKTVVVLAPRNALVLGDTVTLTASALDAKGRPLPDAPIEWSVSDTTVLRVDETGLVRGVGFGAASVQAASGSASGLAEITVGPREVPVPAGVEFVAVSVGYTHACALTSGGQAYCWGVNNFGQLGTGDRVARDTPTPVIGGHTFTLIDAGQESTCALGEDSRIYCWGRNTHGTIGLGTNTPPYVEVPTVAAGGMSFAHIGLSQHMSTCGATPEDVVYCWGRNDVYQLGRAPQESVDTAIAPLGTDVGLRWVDGWMFHTCGLTPAGEAYCWGQPRGGATGVDPNDPAPWWVAKQVAGGHAFVKLALGDARTCGITTSGAAYCWGENSNGQLGNGTIGDYSPTPMPVTGGHTFVDIGANVGVTCGLTAGGEIYCWGWNIDGSLGNAWMERSPQPIRVDGDHTYRAIGMGWYGVCAIRTDGRLVCWGDLP